MSLLFCLTTAGLWVRSKHTADFRKFGSGLGELNVLSSVGQLTVAHSWYDSAVEEAHFESRQAASIGSSVLPHSFRNPAGHAGTLIRRRDRRRRCGRDRLLVRPPPPRDFAARAGNL